jgi:hypothetical protein
MDFNSQIVFYTHDAATDRLLVYKDYHGIAGEGRDEQLSESDAQQLLSSWIEQRLFVFENWPSLSMEDIRQDLAKPLPKNVDERELALQVAYRKIDAALLTNTHISNGPFYYDSLGHLCGVQRVTFYNVSEILAALNAVVRAQYALDAARESDRVVKERLDRAASDRDPFVRLEGNRIVVRVSQSIDEYLSYRADRLTRMLLESGVDMTFANDITTITLGRVDSNQERLLWKGEVDRPFDPGAERFIRERFGIAERFDPDADAKYFFSHEPMR